MKNPKPLNFMILGAKEGNEGAVQILPSTSERIIDWFVGEDFIITNETINKKFTMRLVSVENIGDEPNFDDIEKKSKIIEKENK